MKNFMKKTAKGFTLVELIIVIGLMSVLMIMVGLIMKPISQVFADTTSYTEDRYVMDGIAQYLDDSLKYADRIFVLYDAASGYGFCGGGPGSDGDSECIGCNGFAYAMAESWGGEFARTALSANRTTYNKMHCIAIINDFDYTRCGVKSDDFTNNNGVKATCRIYKSEYINSEREAWLVGGEAFYGDGAYFFNLENTGPDNVHMAQGDISYTLYSFDMKQYSKLTEREVKNMCNNIKTMRQEGKTPDDIMDQHGQYIANRIERTINFKNDINWGQVYEDDNGHRELGVVTPVNAKLGTEHSTIGPGDNTPGVHGDNGANFVEPAEGVNIFIFYTVPE